MIDTSEATWITPRKIIGVKCSNCGKTIDRPIVKSILEKNRNIFCSLKCSREYRETEDRAEYEPDFNNAYYQPIAPAWCRNKFGIEKCTECWLPECKEVIYDRQRTNNLTGVMKELIKSAV